MANAIYNPNTQKAPNPVARIKAVANSPEMQKRFAEVLGDKAPAFLAGVVGAVSVNKQLLQANPNSVLQSAMVAATLNLSCVPSLGQAALVPYGGECQFQVMTRGLIQLAQRTGQYRNINAGEVYEDEYDGDDLLTGEVSFHRVKGGFRDQGRKDKIVGYFAYIETVTGFKKTEYWTKEDVNAHRKRFSKSKNGPWVDNFDAMARKTVLKSLLNHYGPMSVDSLIAKAISEDQKVYGATDDEGAYKDNPNFVGNEKEAVDASFKESGENIPPTTENAPSANVEPSEDDLNNIFNS